MVTHHKLTPKKTNLCLCSTLCTSTPSSNQGDFSEVKGQMYAGYLLISILGSLLSSKGEKERLW